MTTKSRIFGNESHGLSGMPFALNFASLQEETLTSTDELSYNSKLQVSDFSQQDNKVWNGPKTCTVMTPVGNDPKDRIFDYDWPD
jgi:hypothetical protein